MTKSEYRPPISRRTLLKSGLCSLCALSAGNLCFAQRGRGGMNLMPVMPDENNPAIAYYPEACQRCGDCRLVCRDMQTVKGRPNAENDSEACVYCGQCATYCPEGALTERFDFPRLAPLLDDQEKTFIAALAPSVPVSIGEMYRLDVGTDLTAPLIAALKTIGFRYVLDTSFAADLTIMEEASELVRRLKENAGPLPLITSCCPAWVRFCELFFPAWTKNLSTTKSPFMSLGALIKTWYAQKMELDPEKIVSVALAPCTAKKYEITLPFGRAAGRTHHKASMVDFDFALTTRETAYLLHERGEKLAAPTEAQTNAPDTFDSLLGNASSGGMIFGATGGVAESLLRTAYFLMNGENAPENFLDTETLGSIKGTRTITADFKSKTVKVAVVHGLGNARELIESLDAANPAYDVIEVMACRGGCLGGGGQPLTPTGSRDDLRKKRIAGLRSRAAGEPVHLCHENPDLQTLYTEFLSAPFSDISRELLHR